MDGNIEVIRRAMRALGDPFRWDLVQLLAERGEVGLSELAPEVALGKSTVSYHLRLLREAHLITVRNDGRNRFVQLDRAQVDVVVTMMHNEFSRMLRIELSA